ncbi:MAG: YdcF family protein [Pseudomonadota bacterium]
MPVVMALAMVWFGFGFNHFVASINAQVTPLEPRADGMVVMTGGAARIEVALELLERNSADRLLISGVYAGTDASSLVDRTQSDPHLFTCCVDIDKAALDTVGNARETALWAKDHAFASLLVVTSAYHMPRTVRELEAQLPGVELIAYPIHAAVATAQEETRHAQTWPVSVLAREFLKLQLSGLRHFLAG